MNIGDIERGSAGSLTARANSENGYEKTKKYSRSHMDTIIGLMRSRFFARAFDRLYSEAHRSTLERWIVGISVAGFLFHLALIFFARSFAHAPAVLAAAGENYLSAIYTPFSIILFYEVLILISALPQSTTRSIATQFEIVSLIFIRGFFKDIASLDLENLHLPATELMPALLEVTAGLTMFLLVSIFQHAASKRSPGPSGHASELQQFIERKKFVALVLTAVFVSLAARTLWDFAIEIIRGLPSAHASAAYYSDVFTVMIFTDVLILILSLLVSDRYELVFRNAAFVIATILIRFSLTAAHPYGAFLGVAGMLFGIAAILIFNYAVRVRTPRAVPVK